MKCMDENTRLVESLIENAADYTKTSLKLAKLKALDKTAEVVSTLIPKLLVFLFFISFMLFLNIGLSFWLGEILGSTSFGFYSIASFYGLIALLMRLFMYNWLKKRVGNNFINQLLN